MARPATGCQAVYFGVMIVVVGVLAACGGPGSPQPTRTSTPEAPVTTTPPTPSVTPTPTATQESTRSRTETGTAPRPSGHTTRATASSSSRPTSAPGSTPETPVAPEATPAFAEGGPPVQRVVTGGAHTCVLDEYGEVSCWGSNGHGQTDVAPGKYRAVSAGRQHTCAIRESGELVCWGWRPHPATEAPAELR